MLLVIEGVVMCFLLLLICVIGIANGPVGLVVFYEQEVKDRVVALGLITRDRIKKISAITVTALFVPMLILVPYIYGKTLVKKWVGTLVGFPILAAVLAGLMQILMR